MSQRRSSFGTAILQRSLKAPIAIDEGPEGPDPQGSKARRYPRAIAARRHRSQRQPAEQAHHGERQGRPQDDLDGATSGGYPRSDVETRGDNRADGFVGDSVPIAVQPCGVRSAAVFRCISGRGQRQVAGGSLGAGAGCERQRVEGDASGRGMARRLVSVACDRMGLITVSDRDGRKTISMAPRAVDILGRMLRRGAITLFRRYSRFGKPLTARYGLM